MNLISKLVIGVIVASTASISGTFIWKSTLQESEKEERLHSPTEQDQTPSQNQVDSVALTPT